jgi:hypothetical protein
LRKKIKTNLHPLLHSSIKLIKLINKILKVSVKWFQYNVTVNLIKLDANSKKTTICIYTTFVGVNENKSRPLSQINTVQ